MAVVQTKKVQRTVGEPNAEYESVRRQWQINRAICTGETLTKELDLILDLGEYTNLLLPFSNSMSQLQYNFYRSEAELPGVVSQYTKMLVGALLRKQPRLELPADVPEDAEEWLLDAFGQDSTPLAAFLEKALIEELQTSRAWVFVTYPHVEKPEEMTQEDFDRLKPYPVLWRGDQVINWRLAKDEVTGDNTLLSVIVKGYTDDFSESEFHPEKLETVWVHDVLEGYYRVRTYQLKTPADGVVASGKPQPPNTATAARYELVSTETDIIVNGERLRQIPAWPLNGSVELTDPILTPLVDKEISLYNKLSRRNHLLYGAATYTPVIASDMSDEDFEDIVGAGLGSWVKLRQGDEAFVLDTPTSALSDMDRAISAGYEEMAKLGIRMLSPEVSQSGVALELRNASQTALLGTLNLKVSNQLADIMAFMLSWRYRRDYTSKDVKVTLSSDFSATPIGEGWARLATDWYQSGLIPRSIWLNILKENDLVEADYDDESGQQEIAEDELIPNAQDLSLDGASSDLSSDVNK